MQTFLPYESFLESARCLDRQRLGKQRAEALTILRTLKEGGGWANHPAVRMWAGHRDHLALYGAIICNEWIKRGYRDTCRQKIHILHSNKTYDGSKQPWWLGDPHFHRSHRAALLAKDYEWYSQFGWVEIPQINYWWPTKHDDPTRAN